MVMTVSEAFDEFRTCLEPSKSLQDAVTTHHNTVRDWIEAHDPSIKTSLIGSLQRRTRIRPRPNKDTFDIDILVVLSSFVGWNPPSGGVTPAAALDKIGHIVEQNETYDRMGPETDSPAISIDYADDVRVELVPAYRDEIGQSSGGTPTPPKGRGYWVPKNNGWAIADYDYDAAAITKENDDCDGHLIPTIKMLKAAKRIWFDDMQSYHLETMALVLIPTAVNHLKQRGEPISYAFLVAAFFTLAKDEILKIAHIVGSKSSTADSYMSSTRRQELSGLFDRLAAHGSDALGKEDAEAIRAWGQVFGSFFPSGSATAGALWTPQRPKAL